MTVQIAITWMTSGVASTWRHSRDRCSQAFPVFHALLLPCIILNANRRTKKRGRPGNEATSRAQSTPCNTKGAKARGKQTEAKKIAIVKLLYHAILALGEGCNTVCKLLKSILFVRASVLLNLWSCLYMCLACALLTLRICTPGYWLLFPRWYVGDFQKCTPSL